MVMHSRTFASGDESDLTARFSEEGLLITANVCSIGISRSTSYQQTGIGSAYDQCVCMSIGDLHSAGRVTEETMLFAAAG